MARFRTPGAEESGAQMTLFDHLRELRGRLVKCSVAIVVGAVICYLFYDQIFRFITSPYCDAAQGDAKKDCALISIDVVGAFLFKVKASTYAGVVLALPVIMWQLWRFITPALYSKERRYAFAFVGSAVGLFLFGAFVAYLSLVPMFEWLNDNIGPQKALQTVDSYFEVVSLMMIGFGAGFEFPLLLIALQMIGILDNKTLREYRRHAFVIIIALAAVITPGGDPISLFLLAIPMYIFYEASILIGWFLTRKRRAAAKESAAADTVDA